MSLTTTPSLTTAPSLTMTPMMVLLSFNLGCNSTIVCVADYSDGGVLCLWVSLRELLASSLLGMSVGSFTTIREPNTSQEANEPRV